MKKTKVVVVNGVKRYVTQLSESDIQIAYFDLLDKHCDEFPFLIFINASSNGADVSVAQRMFLIDMGLRSGFPDVFIPFPSKQFNGLFIEFKSAKGKQSPRQKIWESFVKNAGYNYFVCQNANEAYEATITHCQDFICSKNIKEINKIALKYIQEIKKR